MHTTTTKQTQYNQIYSPLTIITSFRTLLSHVTWDNVKIIHIINNKSGLDNIIIFIIRKKLLDYSSFNY